MEEVTARVYLVSINRSRYLAVYGGGHAKLAFLHAWPSAWQRISGSTVYTFLLNNNTVTKVVLVEKGASNLYSNFLRGAGPPNTQCHIGSRLEKNLNTKFSTGSKMPVRIRIPKFRYEYCSYVT